MYKHVVFFLLLFAFEYSGFGQMDRRWYYLALSEVQSGKIEIAQGRLKDSLLTDPGFAEAWMLLGNIYYNKAQYDTSSEMYERSIHIKPLPEAYKYLGHCYFRMDQCLKASAMYDKYLSYSMDGGISNLAGICYLREKNYVKAKEYFVQALLISDTFHVAHLNLGYIQFSFEDYVSASYHYRKRLEYEPDDKMAMNGLAKSLEKLGKLSESLDVYRRLLQRSDSFSKAPILSSMARLYRNSNNPRLALESYISAENLDPENYSYTLEKAMCYLDLSEYDEALNYFQLYQQERPEDGRVNLPLARVYRYKGDKNLCKFYLDKATVSNPEMAIVWFEMGEWHLRHGKKKDALPFFEKAHFIDPSFVSPI